MCRRTPHSLELSRMQLLIRVNDGRSSTSCIQLCTGSVYFFAVGCIGKSLFSDWPVEWNHRRCRVRSSIESLSLDVLLVFLIVILASCLSSHVVLSTCATWPRSQVMSFCAAHLVGTFRLDDLWQTNGNFYFRLFLDGRTPSNAPVPVYRGIPAGDGPSSAALLARVRDMDELSVVFAGCSFLFQLLTANGHAHARAYHCGPRVP